MRQQVGGPGRPRRLEAGSSRWSRRLRDRAIVLQHPRCQNCHPAGDAPLQGEEGRVHSINVLRGPTGFGMAGAECTTGRGRAESKHSRCAAAKRSHAVSMYTTISFEARDGVTHITLNRPDSANTLNATLSSELTNAVVRCEDDADVRAVVVTGAGSRFFCASAEPQGILRGGKRAQEPCLPIPRRALAPRPRGRAGRGRGERRGGGRRHAARVRVRPGDRRRVSAVHDGLHQGRSQPGRIDHVLPPMPRGHRTRARSRAAESDARRGGGARANCISPSDVGPLECRPGLWR
jgi:Enoyl-CoA hydratase/isomerase